MGAGSGGVYLDIAKAMLTGGYWLCGNIHIQIFDDELMPAPEDWGTRLIAGVGLHCFPYIIQRVGGFGLIQNALQATQSGQVANIDTHQ